MDLNRSPENRGESLTPVVAAFQEAWASGRQPPRIEEYLPAEPPSIRQTALVELIKLDMEQRLKQGAEGWRLEAYGERFGHLRIEKRLWLDLIYEEYQLRRSVGHEVTVDEYCDRFPDRAAELEQVLERDLGGTTLQPAERPALEPFAVGQTVGDFQLIRLLGEGGFARVFLSYQVSMQRFVALKVSSDHSTEPQMLAQFDHPHIVRVYDQRTAANQTRLLYMEYVAGGTLAAVIPHVKRTPVSERTGRILVQCLEEAIGEGGPVGVPETARHQLEKAPWPDVICQLGAKLAQALDYAHRQKVLHRDIKPANVLLTADGNPKLADFNIGFQDSTDVAPGCGPVSAEDVLGGTLAYMSPEQMEACNPYHPRRADELDPRTDIYSLGLVLWELLDGELPFDYKKPLDVQDALEKFAEQRRTQPPRQTSVSVGGTTEHLRHVLLRCLSPDPQHRYQDGRQLAQALRLCLEPRTLYLLRTPGFGWRRAVACWPLFSILIVALIPHALAGLFNLSYNRQAIISYLDNSQQTFWKVQFVINSIAFPLGLICLGYLTWPVARQLLGKSPGSSPENLAKVRRRALQLGQITAVIGVTEWLIAGLAYPISLHVLAGGLTIGDYLHFAASLTLCGLIAAAYPFFFVTALATRVLYPATVRQTEPSSEDRVWLEQLAQKLNVYLFMAGGVPALAMLALLITGVYTGGQQTFALIVLSVLGAMGFALAFALYRMLQQDLAALAILRR